MTEKLKNSHIFEPNHNNKNLERIKKWVEAEDFSALDLMAIVCMKLAALPQTRSNTVTRWTDTLQIRSERYNFIIAKVV